MNLSCSHFLFFHPIVQPAVLLSEDLCVSTTAGEAAAGRRRRPAPTRRPGSEPACLNEGQRDGRNRHLLSASLISIVFFSNKTKFKCSLTFTVSRYLNHDLSEEQFPERRRLRSASPSPGRWRSKREERGQESGSLAKGRTVRRRGRDPRLSRWQVRNNSADSSLGFLTRTGAHVGTSYLVAWRERRVATPARGAAPGNSGNSQRAAAPFNSTGRNPPGAGGGPGLDPSSGGIGALPLLTPWS